MHIMYQSCMYRIMYREVSPGIHDLCYFPQVRNAHRLHIVHNDIYREKTVVTTADVRSLLVCDYDLNHQRTVEFYGGKKFNRPCGLVLGPNDEIVVSDRGSHQLIVFDSDLKFCHVIGHRGSGNGKFNWPSGLYIDADGFIYICC